MRNERAMQMVENNGLEVAIVALNESIARWTEKGEQHTTAIPGLSLFRREDPTDPISGLYVPSICMVAQGAKRVVLGYDSLCV